MTATPPWHPAEDRLEVLLGRTTVLDDHRARVGDEVLLADPLFHPARADEPPIVTPLQQALYQRFYCPLPTASDGRPDEAGDADEFLGRLRAANCGREFVSPDWALHTTSPDGRHVLFSGEVVHVAAAADVTPARDANGSPTGRAAVRFAVERVAAETGFYFAFGETPADAFDRTVVARLYFNLGPAGAEAWLGLVTGTFNRARLPFTLKCPLQPAAYRRSDSCVLYVPRRYVPLGFALVEQFLPPLAAELRPTTPLFALPLAPGVGLADDPGTGESFGQHRTRLVARGLARVGGGFATLARKRQAVADEFAAAGLSLDRPHLNAGATAPAAAWAWGPPR